MPPREAFYSVISFHPHTSFLSYGGRPKEIKRTSWGHMEMEVLDSANCSLI